MVSPGSHGLLKGFMKGLGLTVHKTLPSAAALRDYGNTSPSSTYYVLAYLESLVGVKKGQKLMQVRVCLCVP
jgi:3-ketoacyl-CoA synthase